MILSAAARYGGISFLDLSSGSRTGGTVTGIHRSFRTWYCQITQKKIVFDVDNGGRKSVQQLPSQFDSLNTTYFDMVDVFSEGSGKSDG